MIKRGFEDGMKILENVGAALRSSRGEEARGDGEAFREPVATPALDRPFQERGRSRSPAIIRSSWVPQIEETIRRSCEYFFGVQHPDGYWWSELESNVTITAEYVMLTRLLSIPVEGKRESIVRYFLNHQDENGAWGLYYGDGGELSTTIEAYFALKLLGERADSEPMSRARGFILKHGGLEASRVFTKIWLAQFGQYEWKKIPSMPVELVLLPPEFYFNIYEFSSWARGTVVPLSIVLCVRPQSRLPDL